MVEKTNIKHIRAASEIKNDINDMRHHDDDFGAQANTNIKKRGQSLSHHNQQQKNSSGKANPNFNQFDQRNESPNKIDLLNQ
tara:strand:- start:28 stop:273 length:246 start_codon:yes stop_codon:yes gene_type:complete